MVKRALITGITGQDGAYLARYLLDKDYLVYGVHRRNSSPNLWRLEYLNLTDRVKLIAAELTDSSAIFDIIKTSQPDEIYHLASPSFVGSSFEHPVSSAEVTGLSVTRILEAIRCLNKKIKFYQASTIEMYGKGDSKPLTEETAFQPANPYAVAKLYGYWITSIYREGYGIFGCSGILFNHESPLRGLEFVTRKISNAVARISLGLDDKLILGNMDARRDWGYAPDFIEAMWLMLQKEKPDDYVIATGETHTVKEFVQKAFSVAGLDWTKYVKTDPKLQRQADLNYLQGDNSKARSGLGWQPKVKFNQLVELMVKEDITRWQRWQNEERFPWDIPVYRLPGKK